jgi:hypothetical protein
MDVSSFTIILPLHENTKGQETRFLAFRVFRAMLVAEDADDIHVDTRSVEVAVDAS